MRTEGALRSSKHFLVARPSKFRNANVEAALTVRSIALKHDVKCVFADLPRGFEALLRRCASPREALDSAVRIGLVRWSESVVRAYEPIVSCIDQLVEEGIEVVCYLEAEELEREQELATRVAQLVLRASIKRIDEHDLNEWFRVLDEYGGEGWRRVDYVAELLNFAEGSRAIILAGLEGLWLAKELRSRGYEVAVRVVGTPYLRSPLEVMIIKHSRGELTADELKSLISDYVDYVRNYVLRYEDLEEAHKKWAFERAPWLRSLLSLNSSLSP
jgi:hypothetical protein